MLGFGGFDLFKPRPEGGSTCVSRRQRQEGCLSGCTSTSDLCETVGYPAALLP